MVEAPTPPNEPERLAALERYEILDTLPERAFDDLTLLASQICGAPIALISLVDRHRQWFKSKLGIDAPETSRDIAFCSHAILKPGELLIVRDATLDLRFAENPLVTSDPRIRFYAGAPLVTRDGLPLGTLCVIDRKPGDLGEDQQEALHALSRQVVAQLDLRLNLIETRRSKEEELGRKDAFLRHVSHELRTPLAAIHQFVSLLLDEVPGPLNEQQREFADLAFKNAGELKSMIADLLDVARAQAGKLRVDLRPTSARDFVLEVVGSLRESAAANGISIGCQLPDDLPLVLADFGRCRQILTNLIDNAIKFTPPGGSISVEVVPDPGDASLLRFSVIDTGRGIAQESLERIFEELHQEASSDAAGRGGLGLGLAICNALVKRHEGRIWVESKLGSGSAFHFTLPIFDLEALIDPVLVGEGRVREAIGLLRITLEPGSPLLRPVSGSILRELRHLLGNLIFYPQTDVVLPPWPGDAHHVLIASDAAGVRAATRRFREHLATHAEKARWEVRVHVESRLLTTPAVTAGAMASEAVRECALGIASLLESPNWEEES